MRNNKGFTLVEVAVVLVVGGIILGSVSAYVTTYMKSSAIASTQVKLEAIDDAVQQYLVFNGRLPCAASFMAQPDTSMFGIEVTEGGTDDCLDFPSNPGETVRVPGSRNGAFVRIGAVPVRTLNLPDTYAYDSWGARLTFAVTANLAVSGQYSRDGGAVAVIDSGGNSSITPAGSAHYVVVSHGPNKAGAVISQTTGFRNGDCLVTALEGENCNDDSTFRNTMLIGTNNNANFYDDLVRVRVNAEDGLAAAVAIPAGAILAFDLAACPSGWTEVVGMRNNFVRGASAGNPVGDQGLVSHQPSGGADQILFNYVNYLYCEKD